MQPHGRRVAALPTIVLVIILTSLILGACNAAPFGASPKATARAATPSPKVSGPPAARSAITWTAFTSDGAIQVWIAAADASPRLLATVPLSLIACPKVTAGLSMLSPDGAHVLVSLGEPCGSLIDDPGPLVLIDTASGQSSAVSLPINATVLPQLRSYGWVDNRTIFAFSQYNDMNVDTAYLYSLDTRQAETLAGLVTPVEGVVRGSTLFYLQSTSGEGGIQSILRRYDLAHRVAIPGGIDLGAYAACSECPSMVVNPGWDVAADGGHVVFQRTTVRSGGGFTNSQIIYAAVDGSHQAQIAQYLATSNMVHLRLSPDGKRVAITAAYPTPAVITACVDTAGTKDDPCFATYRPDAASFAAWAPDGRSFLAATVDSSYERPTSPGSLVRYTLGSAAGQSIAVAYAPWSLP